VTLLLCGAFAAPSVCIASDTLKLTIIPHRSSMGNEQAYRLLVAALEKETGFTFAWVGSKTYQEVIGNIVTRQADIGYLGAFSYVAAQDEFGVRLLARTRGKEGTDFYHSMIVVHKDAGINSLGELKGRSIAFTDPKSTSGYFLPVIGLKKAGIELADFREVHYVTRHANSLLAVYHRHLDAGAISSTALNKVNIDFEQLKPIWRSAPIYRGPWVTRQDLPDEIFYRLQTALFKISVGPDAERIFQDLGTKGFVAAKDSDYDNIRQARRFFAPNSTAEKPNSP
jgi:phosphonate transport system substrate-binding protein